MSLSVTETSLTLSGPENPIASLAINGSLIDFTAYDGDLSSVAAQSNYTLLLSGFGTESDAFNVSEVGDLIFYHKIKSQIGVMDDLNAQSVTQLYQYTDNFILCTIIDNTKAQINASNFSQVEYRVVDNKGDNVVRLTLNNGITVKDSAFLIHINSTAVTKTHKGTLIHQFVAWDNDGYKLPPIFKSQVQVIPVLEPTL